MIFSSYELPIAYSMINAAKRVKPRRDGRHPFERYFYLWTAFNNIYTTIAYREGRSTQVLLQEDGAIKTIANGSVRIPKVKTVSEREQIYVTLEEFDDKLKQSLILYQSINYFVYRIPSWQGTQIKYDVFGQRVNGVINVNYTISIQYPVWSPIDTHIYERFLSMPDNEPDRDFLTKQIVDLLYTIRNNLLHGGKRFDDANDLTVVEKALPLLELIVSSFLNMG